MLRKKFFLVSLLALSLLLNAITILLGAIWLSGRLKPIVVTPEEMQRVIKELSWNSAGRWRVVEHDNDRILVEYRLPIFDITRYELPARSFRLAEDLETRKAPFELSFDECDISARVAESDVYNCMKLRDLAPRECKGP